MNGRGKNGSSAVANRVWSWAIAKWGNLYVDQMFCDRMDELLSEKWPNLKNWGGKQRDWSTIMKHRFSNAREANDGAYKSSAIPSVDMSSPAKRLLEDGLNLRVDDDAPSMYLGSLDDPGLGEEGSAAGTATGVPVHTSAGEGTGAGGVHVARGVAVPAAQLAIFSGTAGPSSAGSASAGSARAVAPDSSDDEEPPISSRRNPPAATARTSTTARAPQSCPRQTRPAPLQHKSQHLQHQGHPKSTRVLSQLLPSPPLPWLHHGQLFQRRRQRWWATTSKIRLAWATRPCVWRSCSLCVFAFDM